VAQQDIKHTTLIIIRAPDIFVHIEDALIGLGRAVGAHDFRDYAGVIGGIWGPLKVLENAVVTPLRLELLGATARSLRF
jgi:hypothetical protein